MFLTITTLYSYYPAAFWICLGMTLVLAGAGVGGAVALQRRGAFTTYDAVVASLLWCYAVTVLYLTVIGRYAHTEYRAELRLFESHRQVFCEGNTAKLSNLLINLAMLAPVSFLFAELAGRKKRRAPVGAVVSADPRLMLNVPTVRLRPYERRPTLSGIGVAFAFSLLIEGLQFVSRTGTFEIDDIFNNLVGAVAAGGAWKIWNAIRNRLKQNNSVSS